MPPSRHRRPMDAPKVLCQKSAIKYLKSLGYTRTLGGNHVVKMEKAGCRPIIVPHAHGRDYGPSLRASILKQAALDSAA